MSEGAPLGFAQIAFAGHARPEDLGESASVRASLIRAWQMLAEAGLRRGRLLSGYADGADVLAIETWQAAGLGPVQAVMPFLPTATGPELPADLADGATWLDGVTARAGRRSPHLAQSRWIIAAADLLVAVWNGQGGRGSGGTSETVRLALSLGVPVLWLHTGEDTTIRLLRPEFLPEDNGQLELLVQLAPKQPPLVVEATAEGLRRVLSELGLDEAAEPPADEPELPPERPLAWPWRTYGRFRRLMGGRGEPNEPAPVPADLAAQPGYRQLSRARREAAREADRMGAVHRSKQIILLAIAIGMAVAASVPALWPVLKVPFVAIELVLALLAFAVWFRSERGEQHLRWGAARKRAEDLRLERVAWAAGLSTVPHDPLATNANVARRARRFAGSPIGRFDRERVKAWGAWMVDELLTRQIAYHRDQVAINGRISHRVHRIEDLSFALLVVSLFAYLGAVMGLSFAGAHPPAWAMGWVFLVGVIVPAIGAAGLALEATLSLEAQAHRSAVLRRRLETLKAELGDEWILEDLQSVVRTAIKLQRAQEDHWSSEASRRRLFRGG